MSIEEEIDITCVGDAKKRFLGVDSGRIREEPYEINSPYPMTRAEDDEDSNALFE